jgi:hypothetical protein
MLKSPFSFFMLAVNSGLVALLAVLGKLGDMINWLIGSSLGFAFVFFVIYLFLYWLISEIKNVWLEWQYMEDN